MQGSAESSRHRPATESGGDNLAGDPRQGANAGDRVRDCDAPAEPIAAGPDQPAVTPTSGRRPRTDYEPL